MNNKLNELMAEKVMGWKLDKGGGVMWCNKYMKVMCPKIEWNPTEDIAQAMMCLDKWMIDTNGGFEMTSSAKNGNQIILQSKDSSDLSSRGYDILVSGGNSTLPKAICEAISEAIGGER